MQVPNKKAASFSFHRRVFYLSSVSLISQWIRGTRTFISSHVVMVGIVLGVLAENVENGDEIKQQNVTECCVLKALFSLFWHTEINSMARKLVKWAKFVLVITNTHMLKYQESSGTELRISKVRWPTTVTAKKLTSSQKEKPPGKKNNLTAKRITTTSRQKK